MCATIQALSATGLGIESAAWRLLRSDSVEVKLGKQVLALEAQSSYRGKAYKGVFSSVF